MYQLCIRSFISLFYISLGVGDYWNDDTLDIDQWLIIFNEGIYIVFLLISTVLMLNLLIAIFSETIERIGNESEQNWLFQKASTILLIERRVDKKCCGCCNHKIYKRTGVQGKDYGFMDEKGELYYIAFYLHNEQDYGDDNKLVEPKKRPNAKELDHALDELKNKEIQFI